MDEDGGMNDGDRNDRDMNHGDIEAIKGLKARYFRLMDQKKWDLWEQVFSPDVHIDTSDGGVGDFGVMDGNTTFRTFLEPQLEGVITVHHGHTPEITLTGADSATGTWAMEDHLEWPDGKRMWGTGWYEEQYRKHDDGQWRISAMTLKRIKIEIEGSRVWPPA